MEIYVDRPLLYAKWRYTLEFAGSKKSASRFVNPGAEFLFCAGGHSLPQVKRN